MNAPVMDLEALKHLQKTAVDAAGIDVKNRVCVRADLPDKTQWGLIDKNGDMALLPVSQPRRAHLLLSVQEVVVFSRDFAGTAEAKRHSPIVWIGRESIIVTLDDRRLFGDHAVYEFSATPEWELLQRIAEKTDGFDQKSFLRLMRVEIAEMFVKDAVRLKLIEDLRKVRAQQTSAIGQGTGSYEASVVTDQAEKTNWPEEFTLKARPIDDPALPIEYEVRCVFEVEAMPRPSFTIAPLVAHIARAENKAREVASEVIREQLKGLGIPIYLGKPE